MMYGAALFAVQDYVLDEKKKKSIIILMLSGLHHGLHYT